MRSITHDSECLTRNLAMSAIVMVLTCLPGRADVPVRGDGELLTILIAAQESSATALERGRMRIKVSEFTYSSPGQKRTDLTGEAVMIWDGERQHWKYHAKNKNHSPGSRLDEQLRDRVFVRTQTQLMAYNPGPNRGEGSLTVMPVRRGGYPPQFERGRALKWFVFEGWDRGNWSEYFDPANEKRSKTVTGIQVRQMGDRIIVDRSYPDDGSMHIEASLAHGGNVVRYENHFPSNTSEGPQERIETGTYDWAQDKNDVWYLQNAHYQHADAADPDNVTWEYDLEVLEFTSTPELTAETFSVKSIQLAKGDRVDVRGKNRKRYRFGMDESEVTQELLDKLAEELKQAELGTPE